MKTYKLKKELPGQKKGSILVRSSEGNRGNGVLEMGETVSRYIEMIYQNDLGKGSDRLEEVTKPSYIVTEEGEIIGEYEGYCWFTDGISQVRKTYGSIDTDTHYFITKEQAEAYVTREKARRELWMLYYENGYEENKGNDEVYLNINGELNYSDTIANTAIPHCTSNYQSKMIRITRVQELYKIIFGIDDTRSI